MESTSTPRISAALMDSYVGQNVIIVGKVQQLRGDTAFLEADGQIQANLNRDCHLMVGNGAQIIGKVNPDLTIKVLNAMDLGNNQHQQRQSLSQQLQPQPESVARPQEKQKETVPVAEITTSSASVVVSRSASTSLSSEYSQPSRVITPPINELSELSIQGTSQSPQSTAQPSILHNTQWSPHAQEKQDTQYTHYTIEEEATSSHQRLQNKNRSPRQPYQDYMMSGPYLEKGSSTSSPQRSLSSSPSPIRPPAPVSPESSEYPSLIWPSPPPRPVRPRGRLFRTKSGNLATAAEIRRRKKIELHADELLDMILEDFGGYNGLYDVIAFSMDEVGRWRIIRQDSPEVEPYENRD
ncbi:uncharacterized protein F4822DRAFT_426847 [Hypoxylon trugodes]|uniref:uncharacterized protein n=1 Tax=Hypoxylon trugodes TaxID=326681 RepID=UPI002191AFF1|nr:uncharacterized protein F4822DRAFT_426847 [Hypoxylon trugodes]KAI1390994.1 hypothetical protein F4822DRAFT_426847 [Hypoxylon trugodes]